MTIDRNRIGWDFWLRWVLVTAVGWFGGSLIGFILGSVAGTGLIGSGMLGGMLGYCLLGAALGFGVSLMQWFVLRRLISRAGWWVLASTAGLAVAGGGGYGAAVAAFGYSEGLEGLGSFSALLGWIVVAALGGALTSICQWLVLRGQVYRAGWWIAASILGWGFSMGVAGAFEVVDARLLVGLVVGGFVLGAITGGALVSLLRQHVPEA